jgi:hypothetical protein
VLASGCRFQKTGVDLHGCTGPTKGPANSTTEGQSSSQSHVTKQKARLARALSL